VHDQSPVSPGEATKAADPFIRRRTARLAVDAAEAIDNDAFFPTPPPLTWPPRATGGPRSIPEEVFYGAPRPAEAASEEPFTARFARNTLGFAGLLFLMGWIGILAQRGVLRQLVVGAPVFEEMAKLGLALVVVALLRLRRVWLRWPLAWASGAGFGVLEHYLTYAGEPAFGFAERVAFHAGACGLSMTIFWLVEPLPDPRVRWGSTLASTLLHWANNFGSVAIGVASVFVGGGDALGLGWSLLVTGATFAATFVVAAQRERLRPLARQEAARLFPPLPTAARAPEEGPRSTMEEAPPPPPPTAPPPGEAPEGEPRGP
jgi:hypothetical protein